jgi:hypothetical protein
MLELSLGTQNVDPGDARFERQDRPLGVCSHTEFFTNILNELKTCAFRKSSPSILVMQSAQDRTAQNAPRDRGCPKLQGLFGMPGRQSDHCNGDASQGDREPRTQFRAAKHQDNPIGVSQPSNAYSSHDGTTGCDRDIVAS